MICAEAEGAGPDDHFTAGRHCCVINSGIGCVGSAGRCPTVGDGIVPPAGVVKNVSAIKSTPDDHFAVDPDCRVPESGRGRVGGTGRYPTVGGLIISSAGIKRTA